MDRWIKVCALEEIPLLGARVVKITGGEIAVFRTAGGEVFALRDRCPHRGGPLSQGIVYGRHVACPLHGWSIGLEDGTAMAPDVGCTPSYGTRVEQGVIYLDPNPHEPPAVDQEVAPRANASP
jgi:nitrite reductase (NADH) small subunit